MALHDVKKKYRKFTHPSEVEARLERMLRVLGDLQQGICFIELASDDCEAIQGQLNSCVVSFHSVARFLLLLIEFFVI